MKILPPKTELPSNPIERRHDPRTGDYTTYRPCLRWEFGFSCAFCLVHESDLVAHGIEGTALTGIEHFVPRSADPELVDSYCNCIYACRYCNGSRRTAPNADATGSNLLNPCADAWADHFEWHEFRLEPLDASATYTERTYDLNDPRKLALRGDRARTIQEAFRLLREAPQRINKLLNIAEKDLTSDRVMWLECAEELQRALTSAKRDVARFALVPGDADTSCRCGSTGAHHVPSYLEQQAVQLEAILRQT